MTATFQNIYTGEDVTIEGCDEAMVWEIVSFRADGEELAFITAVVL